jgi:hypothetical protein
MTSIIKVDQIQNAAGTSGLSIDSNGVVTKGVLPAWRVRLSTQQNEASAVTTTVAWNQTSGNNCFIQGGCSLSSGIITVPVAGVYQINMNLRFDQIGGGYIVGRISINGQTGSDTQTYVIDGDPPTDYANTTGSDFFSLDANDTVRIFAQASSDTSWNIHPFSSFSGVLIG